MLTPQFWIYQDGNSLEVKIRAPHGDLKNLDYDHGEFMFLFTCTPYFLRLHFRQMVEEYGNGNGNVKLSSDGDFIITVPKMHKGEHFTHLDLISELLNPTPTQAAPHGRQLVEEIEGEEEEEVDGNEFLHHQKVPQQEIPPTDLKIMKFGYGFGWAKMGIIERLKGEIGRLVDMQNPEEVEIEMRAEKLKELDTEKFNPERYLPDALEPEEELIAIITAPFKAPLELTDEDRDRLKDLKKSKIPKLWATDEEIARSLVDILFSYCYDQRVNEDEPTCESGWTYAKLSPTICYFAKFRSAKESLLASFRRCLAYPLYRSYDLCQVTLKDLIHVVSSGRTALLHILCEIHRIFIVTGDFRYILNDLFITDFIFWIQSVSDEVLEGMRKELEGVIIEKEDIGWDLEMLETEGRLQMANLDSDDDDMIEYQLPDN